MPKFPEIAAADQLITYQGRKYSILNPYIAKNVYMVQLHAHSNNSDGVQTPVQLATAYLAAGYDALAIQDHDFLTPDPAVGGIQHISGVEQSSLAGHRQHIANLFAVAVEPLVADFQQIIDEVREAGALAGLNHPGLTLAALVALTSSYAKWLEEYNFIEIRNAFAGTDDEAMWTALLDANKPVWAVTVDDCHDTGVPASFDKFMVMVFADSSAAADLKESLANGNFYCRQPGGPTITAITLTGNTLTVTVGANADFEFLGKGDRDLKTENGVLTSSYTIEGGERYVRVRITDVATTELAWTQPLFILVLEGTMGDVPKTPVPALVNYTISADQVTIPSSKHARVQFDSKKRDVGADFRSGYVFNQEQADAAGCTAILITDSTVNFQTIRTHVNALRYAMVTWSSDLAGTLNLGVGYVGATITANTLEIYKVSGVNFANNYYYTIMEAWFEVPLDGEYDLFGAVGYKVDNMVADQYFGANMMINGNSLAGSAFHSAAVKQLIVPCGTQCRLAKGDLITMTAYHSSGADTIVLRMGTMYTLFSASLIQQDI